MLLEFSCKNFKAIRGKATFSLLASKDKSREDELYNFRELNYLRTSVIYGQNGSGKTTLLDAIGYFKKIVLTCNSFQEGDKIPRFHHKLEENTPTSFDIQFVVDGMKYAYGFVISDTQVIEEYLFHYPRNRQAKIFERDEMKYSFGAKYKKELNEIITKSKKNKLFLSTAESWSSLEQIIKPFTFFKRKLVIHSGSRNNWFEYSAKKINDDARMKEKLIEFMQKIGLPVKDIKVKIDKNASFPSDMPTEVVDILNQISKLSNASNPMSIEVKFVYDNYELSIDEESLGTQKLFQLLCPIVDILLNGKVLFYDELENSLHPILVEEIINLFKYWEGENKAQLVFSTHDSSLLDLNLFRRDQIWFSERNPKTSSAEYYSLVELKNVRKDENIKKGFMTGRYSTIPLSGSGLIDILGG